MLPLALSRADGVVWLDPSMTFRAWRLFRGPLRSMCRTRKEWPAGNPDWPMEQWRFGWESLGKIELTRKDIHYQLKAIACGQVWHVKKAGLVPSVLDDVVAAFRDQS